MPLEKLVVAVNLLSWIFLGGAFLFRRRPPRAREVRRGSGWTAGLLLQGASLAMLWAVRRPLFTPFLELGNAGDVALALFASALAVASAGIMIAAERALGRQFAYQARLVEGHKLVTSGPYRFVRHPIYTGFFGLALSTALAWSRWTVLPFFLAAFVIGTVIRVRCEDRLLRHAFGDEFETYARRVPAVIPGLW